MGCFIIFFFQRFKCPYLTGNLQKHLERSLTDSNFQPCFYDYSHLASKLPAADFSHKYISKKSQSWLILKCINDTSSFMSFSNFSLDFLVILVENSIYSLASAGVKPLPHLT